MKIQLKWLSALGKRLVELYSVVLHFPQQVRTYAELELLVVRDLVLPDDLFYITEGDTVVAEAHKYGN
jgi:hypothetical protein